jgi:hypothetical protein
MCGCRWASEARQNYAGLAAPVYLSWHSGETEKEVDGSALEEACTDGDLG